MNSPQDASSKTTGRILRAKLMAPHLSSAVIPRPDLLARLDAGLSRKLTLVSAPTGYGKTTLVNHWLAERKTPSAWLTLDEYDNDPVRFWTYLVTALRGFAASLGKSALSALVSSQPVLFQSVLTALINDLEALAGPCVLVLEDYHTITSPEINQYVSYLLQHLPPALHLILISRSEPALPLGILRARDEMVELGASNLRFTALEAEAFLRQAAHITLPAALLSRLQERTQGWPAGLRLAALSLQDKSPAEAEKFIQSFSGSHRYVADYLIQEVFESQSQAVQAFLLQTCFLERLTGSLCDAVTGAADGDATLEQLARGNLFLVQLERRGERLWYRYNPLFAESIQYLARQRLSDLALKSVFEKASGWYEVHGLYDEAIEAALAAGLAPRAIALIERFIEIHDLAELRTLGRWLEQIPETEIYFHPGICFTYAQVILFSASNRFAPVTAARVEPFLSAAEKMWRELEDRKKLGALLSFRGIVAWWQGDFQKAFLYARQSLHELPDYDVFWRGNSLLIASYEVLNLGRILDAQDKVLEARALLGAAQNIYGVLAAIQILSEIFYWQGELEEAEQLNRRVLDQAVGDESMLDDQGFASLGLANIAYERDELDQAGQLAERAMDLARQRGNELLQAQAAIRQAYIHAARDEFQPAGELLKTQVAAIQNPALLREIQEAQARLSLRSGELHALAGWQALVSEAKESTLSVQREREVLTLARLRIAQGEAGQALEILEGRAADAAENGRLRSQVVALCLEALAYVVASNQAQAAQSLIEALAIGQAYGYRRLFLDEGRSLAGLLQAVQPSLLDRTLSMYVSTLLHSFNPGSVAGQADSALVEPLSPQEQRVLRLLVAGLTNAEIAQELVVSTNTVKTQVKSIYRKLNVASRQEARQVARQLRWS
jgi:ATP/maltotriose-dependent transcriptional regulator MalT